MNLTVLDLDGSVTAKPAFGRMIARGEAAVIDLRELAAGLRLVASHEAWFHLTAAVEPIQTRRGPPVVFTGSGDFHHLTTSLLALHEEPVTVIHFDGRPDWQRWPSAHAARGWVNRALELSHVARVITLGPASGTLVRPELGLGNMEALESGRHEVFPWRHAPSRVFRFYRDTACTWYDRSHLHWQELAPVDWEGFLDDLIARIPTEAVYVTIDKSVLEVPTGMDAMPIDHVVRAITRLADSCRIAGIDVCGDHSVRVLSSPVQRLYAALGPTRPALTSEAGDSRNAQVDAQLLACFRQIPGR
jgi:hypothetical protein